MTILGNLPFFSSLFSSQATKTDRIRKSVGPISTVLKRQPFSTSSQRALPKSSTYYSYKQAETGGASHNNNNANTAAGPEVVTESSILSNFPRPNLMPTLHFSLFGYQSPTENGTNTRKTTLSTCNNCSGPHSTDFCPC